MSLKNQTHTLNLLKEVKIFLTFDEKENTYTKKESISSTCKERKKRLIYTTMYYLFAMPITAPLLFFADLMAKFGLKIFILISIYSAISFTLSLVILFEGSKIDSAKNALEQLQYKATTIENPNP